MVNDSFGNSQGVCRIGEKAADYTLQSGQLGGEFRRGSGVAVKPFLDELDLVAEVEVCGAEGWRVEGGFFETDRAASCSEHQHWLEKKHTSELTPRSRASQLGVMGFAVESTSSACLQPTTLTRARTRLTGKGNTRLLPQHEETSP